MRGCVVLWVVAVVVAGAVASSQHQLAVAWLMLSLQVTSHQLLTSELKVSNEQPLMQSVKKLKDFKLQH